MLGEPRRPDGAAVAAHGAPSAPRIDLLLWRPVALTPRQSFCCPGRRGPLATAGLLRSNFTNSYTIGHGTQMMTRHRLQSARDWQIEAIQFLEEAKEVEAIYMANHVERLLKALLSPIAHEPVK